MALHASAPAAPFPRVQAAAAMPAFHCRRCGNCCRHPGDVRVSEDEVEAMAASLGLSGHEFAAAYTRLREDRRGLILAERPDGACVFLEEEPAACRVQPAKPAQCRNFPFTWRYEDLERICPATRPSD